MSVLTRRAFWENAGLRAAKTFAQAVIGLLAADQSGLLNTNWASLGGAALMAALVSVLTSVASADTIVPKPEESPPLGEAESTDA